MRNGYPGYVAGATFAQALGWNGAPVAVVVRRVRHRAPRRSTTARAQILAGLCDVALVVGADTTPKGFLAPERRRAPGRPRLAALPPARRHQPDVLRALRPPPHGPATARPQDDFAKVKVKNARHGLAQPERALPQGGHASTTCWRRPIVADPLRLLDICATSDGGAAVVLTSHGVRPQAHGHRPTPVRVRGDLHGHADVPATRSSRCRTSPPTRRPALPAPERPFKRLDRARRPTRRPASAPTTSTCAEVYDLSTALELDWYEDIGLCKPGEAEKLLRDGDTTHRRPRSRSTRAAGWPASARPSPPRPSPRCASSPGSCAARPSGRQVEGARVGITANQGLFGHGSSVILTR